MRLLVAALVVLSLAFSASSAGVDDPFIGVAAFGDAAAALSLPDDLAAADPAVVGFALEALAALAPLEQEAAAASLALLARAAEHAAGASPAFDELPAALSEAASADSLGLVVAAMAAHADEPAVQSAGCAALYALARFAPAQAAAGEAGGVGAAAAALASHPLSAGVGRGCAAALGHLLLHPSNKARGVAERVADALARAMQLHAADLGVQRACSGALNNGAAGDAAAKAAALASAAPAQLVASLGLHRRDAQLAEQACGALAVLATGQGGGAALATRGAVEAAERALSAHLGLHKPRKGSGRAARPANARVAASCARALAALAWTDPAVQRAARDALAPEALRSAKDIFPDDAAVQKWADKALEKIVDDAVESMFEGLLGEGGFAEAAKRAQKAR